ncbi:hypothetical protein [Mycobacterium sp. RTGN5]|uniref:hypothetical protein n=1 Tax=Mycobacterium sp. RTGN5 TaxID=3016522 RepID=UPI0029C8C7B0|nr:hypothetical protein [Mycobacterium sp. RTGN5]
MTARSLNPADKAARNVYALDRATTRSGWPAKKYRLTVLGASVADVVSCAGGWLFDRATMGWDIAVAIAECPDDRPIRILGSRLIDFNQALSKSALADSPHAVAVAVGLYERDARVRRYADRQIAGRQTEVAMWGRDWPTELYRLRPMEHHLSAAAQAFKSQAMAAAGEAPDSPGLAESFLVCEHNLIPMAGTQDLTPTP